MHIFEYIKRQCLVNVYTIDWFFDAYVSSRARTHTNRIKLNHKNLPKKNQ